jgi:hypothetical protein
MPADRVTVLKGYSIYWGIKAVALGCAILALCVIRHRAIESTYSSEAACRTCYEQAAATPDRQFEFGRCAADYKEAFRGGSPHGNLLYRASHWFSTDANHYLWIGSIALIVCVLAAAVWIAVIWATETPVEWKSRQSYGLLTLNCWFAIVYCYGVLTAGQFVAEEVAGQAGECFVFTYPRPWWKGLLVS